MKSEIGLRHDRDGMIQRGIRYTNLVF